MNLSLEGKNAVICGSSQGIGYAIAFELALMGANCILLARSSEKLQTAVLQLDTTLMQKHSFHAIDFNDQAAVRELIGKITAEQPVHILVNNSGGPAAGPITDATEDQFLQAFNQHLVVNHILTKGVMESMKKEGYGRIINIISTSVNNVLPGFTRTQRLEAIVENTSAKKGLSVEDVEKEMMQEVPLQRFGEASEIAAVAAFLATPAAAYVNGTSIPVDGGRTGSI